MGRNLPVITATLFLVVLIGIAVFFFYGGEIQEPVDPGGKSPVEIVSKPNEIEVSVDPDLPDEVEFNEIIPPPSDGEGKIIVSIANTRSLQLSNLQAELWFQKREGTRFDDGYELIGRRKLDGLNDFDYPGLELGKYRVVLTSEKGAGQKLTEIDEAKVESKITVYLNESDYISGRVVLASGEPVAGALVTYGDVFFDFLEPVGPDIPFGESDLLDTWTDENGDFFFYGRAKCSVQLLIIAEGRARHYTDMIPIGKRGVRIVLGDGGSLSGTLVDGDSGAPVAGAQLIFIGPNVYDTHSITTDDSGAFEVSGLAAVEHRVFLNHKPYVLFSDSTKVEVKESEQTHVQLKVSGGATITGRVYNAKTGAGIAGVRIGIHNTAGNSYSGSGPTDEDGVYQIVGLAPGNYELSCDKPPTGYRYMIDSSGRSASQLVQLGSGERREGVDFKLNPGAVISGMVVDRDDNPISDVVLTFRSSNRDESAVTQSDQDGRFSITMTKPTNINLEAHRHGYAHTMLSELEVPSEGLHNVKVVLGSESAVSGVLVDEDGKPVGGGGVLLRSVEEWNLRSSARVDDEGYFRVGELAAGEYSILPSVLPNTFRNFEGYQEQKVTVGEGTEVTGLRVVLPNQGQLGISGVVKDSDGNSVSGVLISISGHGNKFSGEDGTFEFTGLEAGQYILNVSNDRDRMPKFHTAEAGTHDVEIILKKLGVLEGVVLDARTRQPITNFLVAEQKSGRAGLSQTRFLSVNNSEGRFRLEKVAGGSTVVIARAEGYAEGSLLVQNILDGDAVEGLEVLLHPGGTLRGLVTDSAHTPLNGVTIMEGQYRQLLLGQTTGVTTGADGRFEMKTLPAAPIVLTAYLEGYAPQSLEVDVTRSDEVQFVLTAGGILEGSLTKDGEPLTQQKVMIVNSEASYVGTTSSDDSGWYQQKGLISGHYSVTSYMLSDSTNQTVTLTKEVEVGDGKTTVANFDLSTQSASLDVNVIQDGETVLSAQISLNITSADTTMTLSGLTDEEGRYLFEGLPAGHLEGTIFEQSGMTQRGFEMEISDGQSHEFSMDLAGGGRLICKFVGFSQDTSKIVILSKDTGFEQVTSMEEIRNLLTQSNVGMAVTQDSIVEISGIEPGTYTLIGVVQDPNQANVPETESERIKLFTEVITIEGEESIEVELIL